MKVTLKVVEDIADWFHTVDKVIESEDYDEFELRADNSVWYLHIFKDDILVTFYHIDNPKTALKELKLRYQKVRKMLKHILKNT